VDTSQGEAWRDGIEPDDGAPGERRPPGEDSRVAQEFTCEHDTVGFLECHWMNSVSLVWIKIKHGPKQKGEPCGEESKHAE
jgi:hypothetical protein